MTQLSVSSYTVRYVFSLVVMRRTYGFSTTELCKLLHVREITNHLPLLATTQSCSFKEISDLLLLAYTFLASRY